MIAGRPNAGKSSLLNALAGEERAIVTAVPGTTRDVLREVLRFDGVELTLVDTAGLRDSDDAIEAEGMRRARAELARADLALLLIDASADAAQRDSRRSRARRGMRRRHRTFVALHQDRPPGLRPAVAANAAPTGAGPLALVGAALAATQDAKRPLMAKPYYASPPARAPASTRCARN